MRERTKEKRVGGKDSINNLSNYVRETAAALMELDVPVQILLQATDPNRDAQPCFIGREPCHCVLPGPIV